jgi:hypothetical protein
VRATNDASTAECDQQDGLVVAVALLHGAVVANDLPSEARVDGSKGKVGTSLEQARSERRRERRNRRREVGAISRSNQKTKRGGKLDVDAAIYEENREAAVVRAPNAQVQRVLWPFVSSEQFFGVILAGM